MPRELTPVSKTDWLREDQPIPGQNFVCVSYVAPEDIIKKYEVYCFDTSHYGFLEAFPIRFVTNKTHNQIPLTSRSKT